MDDLGLTQSTTCPSPGTKPKPVTKAAHQQMMERRLGTIEGSDCVIANLKAELGKLRKEYKDLLQKAQGEELHQVERKSQGDGAINDQDDLETTHHDPTENHDDLGTSHSGGDGANGAQDEGVQDQGGEDPEEEELQGDEKRNYQRQAARANYLCLDRPDIGFATKETMRRLSAPTVEDEIALKRLGRYLMGNPRVVSHFKYGERSDVLIVEGDSDHAGCVRTRKSTSGGVIRWGTHVLKWWSKTQPTLALSSGEAELAAIVRSTSEGLGMQAIMEEFGIPVTLKVKSDAVAAIGIVKRQGLGRVRHLAVGDLWVQQRSKRGEVRYEKLDGKSNTSDMLTKAVDKDTIEKHMCSLGLEFRAGRNSITPAYSGKDDGGPDEGM